jgi:hypothetical protein
MAAVEDEYEGLLSPLNFSHPEIEIEYFLTHVLARDPHNPSDIEETVQRQFGDLGYLESNQQWRREHVYVNCWREDDYENRDMWNHYTRHGNGVVIRSTVDALRRSFAGSPGHQAVFRVFYYEPEHSTVQWDHFTAPLFKRKGFEVEREVRAYVVNTEELYADRKETGVFVPILPEVLIHEIRISPGESQDLLERVTNLATEAGLRVRVVPSLLAAD